MSRDYYLYELYPNTGLTDMLEDVGFRPEHQTFTYRWGRFREVVTDSGPRWLAILDEEQTIEECVLGWAKDQLDVVWPRCACNGKPFDYMKFENGKWSFWCGHQKSIVGARVIDAQPYLDKIPKGALKQISPTKTYYAPTNSLP